MVVKMYYKIIERKENILCFGCMDVNILCVRLYYNFIIISFVFGDVEYIKEFLLFFVNEFIIFLKLKIFIEKINIYMGWIRIILGVIKFVQRFLEECFSGCFLIEVEYILLVLFFILSFLWFI